MIRATAEIIFLHPADARWEIPELIERDFDVEFLDDWIDDDGSAVWILAGAIIAELDESAFFDRVQAIVEPLGGDVVEAGRPAGPTHGSVQPLSN